MILSPFIKELEPSVIDTSYRRFRRSATWVTKLRSYITLPAFSIENIWRGASEIIYRFDYSAENISLLESFPITPPTGANFVACVAWRPAENEIVRYKLWKDVGEILWVPSYSGQRISADNFYIEIWNVNPGDIGGGSLELIEGGPLELIEGGELEFIEQTAVGSTIVTTNPTDLNFYTSKLIIPECKCVTGDVSLVSATTCVDPVFDLTDFEPIFGDYYVLESPCSRLLVKGTPLDSLKIIDINGNWHNLYLISFAGSIYMELEQAITTVGEHLYLTNSSRVFQPIAILGADGNFYTDLTEVSALISAPSTKLILANDAVYYGVSIYKSGDNFTLFVNSDIHQP